MHAHLCTGLGDDKECMRSPAQVDLKAAAEHTTGAKLDSLQIVHIFHPIPALQHTICNRCLAH